MSGHPAGQCSYPGNVTGHIVGEIKGPTTFGTYVVASAATYDSAADATFVEWRTVDPDAEPVTVDEFGIVRLAEVSS